MVNVIVSKIKPDLVIHDKRGKSIHLVELTVPFEANISKSHERNHKKYLELVSDITETKKQIQT